MVAVVSVKIISAVLFGCGPVVCDAVRLDEDSACSGRGAVEFLPVSEFASSNWDECCCV